jgi:hypothetical protein
MSPVKIQFESKRSIDFPISPCFLEPSSHILFHFKILQLQRTTYFQYFKSKIEVVWYVRVSESYSGIRGTFSKSEKGTLLYTPGLEVQVEVFLGVSNRNYNLFRGEFRWGDCFLPVSLF